MKLKSAFLYCNKVLFICPTNNCMSLHELACVSKPVCRNRRDKRRHKNREKNR
jgi:hypothetical protein